MVLLFKADILFFTAVCSHILCENNGLENLGKRVRILLFYKTKHVLQNRRKMENKIMYRCTILQWIFHHEIVLIVVIVIFLHLLSLSSYGYLSKGKDVRNGYFDLYFYVWSVEKQKANSHEQFFQSIYLKRYYFGCDLEFLIR